MNWRMKDSSVRQQKSGESSTDRRRRQARRVAISAAVVAKAHYLAAVDEVSVNPSAVARLRARWLDLEARKDALQEASRAAEPVPPLLPAQGTSYRLF